MQNKNIIYTVLYYKMSSPYTTSSPLKTGGVRHSPARHASPRHISPRHTSPRNSPARHASPRHSPARHSPARNHESPYTNTTNYSHHAKSPTPDSDTGDSSDSSANDYLGGYEKFLATLELSESDDEQHTGKNHKKSKKAKGKKHTEQSPMKPHIAKHADDPWDQPKKKINMQHIDDALAQPVNNTKYEDEDPAAYVDPDMWDHHKTPNAYEGLSNSSRKALLKLKELAALGGSPKPRGLDTQDTQDSQSNTPSRRTPAHSSTHKIHTPTHSSAHKIRINIGTPQQTLHQASPRASHHTSPHASHHEIPEESPYTMQDNHETTEEYNTFKYNEEHPDEDPRNQSPTRRDTHGDFSMGGAYHRSPKRSPRKTPHARHQTPMNNMGRRNTPTYETYKHETPRAESLRQTPSRNTPARNTPTRNTPARHTPARNTPAVIHNPEMSDVEDSPFINNADHSDDENQAPGSPVKSEYIGEQQINDQVEANADDDGDYVETHSPITKNYTGGFGSAFATFGGAW